MAQKEQKTHLEIAVERLNVALQYLDAAWESRETIHINSAIANVISAQAHIEEVMKNPEQ